MLRKMKKDNVNIKVETSSGFSVWKGISKCGKYITEANLKQYFRIMITAIMFGILMIGYNISRQESTMAEIIKNITKTELDEQENLEIRDEITPKVQKEIDKLMYQVGADRVCLFELHNGKSNSTALPFRYVDCTQESVNSDHLITYVGDKYQNIPLGHYKIAYIIAEKKYAQLTVDEMLSQDARFAQQMQECGGQYVCVIMISSNGQNIGFLTCFYDEEMPSDTTHIKDKMSATSKIVGALLDLNVQRKLKNYNDND